MGIFGDAWDWTKGAWDSTAGAAADWFSDAMTGPAISKQPGASYDWAKYDQAQKQAAETQAMLQARARGQGPSVAAEQARIGADQTQRAAASQAASARGGAMQQQAAQRQAQMQGTQAQMAGNQQAMLGRAAEAQGATGQLGQMQMAQQQAEQNRQLELGRQQLAHQGQYMQGEIAQGQQYQAGLGNMMGGAAGLLGAAAMMSDKRAKTDVHDAGADMAQFLDALHSKNYEYKPGLGQESGEQFGVMAQDLEKSKVGQAMVQEGPDGYKRVDTQGKLPMALLAAMAEINDRLRKAGI